MAQMKHLKWKYCVNWLNAAILILLYQLPWIHNLSHQVLASIWHQPHLITENKLYSFRDNIAWILKSIVKTFCNKCNTLQFEQYPLSKKFLLYPILERWFGCIHQVWWQVWLWGPVRGAWSGGRSGGVGWCVAWSSAKSGGRSGCEVQWGGGGGSSAKSSGRSGCEVRGGGGGPRPSPPAPIRPHNRTCHQTWHQTSPPPLNVNRQTK